MINDGRHYRIVITLISLLILSFIYQIFLFDERKIMRLFDILLFKGAKHLKRGQGILSIPKWIADTKHVNLIESFKVMFETRHNIRFI